ncbi:hypothetical protein SS05631_c06440 [Sinorhizobium sp. CCBAU 05631]|nr:hypothetical protein SS05631_c06440 [Sinorhizobium sp. CCBAU 05631]
MRWKTHGFLRETAGFRTAHESYIKIDHCMVPGRAAQQFKALWRPPYVRAL